jgi:Ni/Co efflux regulator RcnB
MYRLPFAPPGYRWIRYYDDALLIDTWDGQVVDVIYDFFW